MVNAHRFLDLEAQADEDDDESELEYEEGAAFLDDRVTNADVDYTHTAIDSSSSSQMETPFDLLIRKYSQKNYATPSAKNFHPSLGGVHKVKQPGDYNLYYLKVKPGAEYDILAAVCTRYLHSPSHELRAAFSNPRHPGKIYLETQLYAERDSSLLVFLISRSDVWSRKPVLVPEADWNKTLRIPDIKRIFAPGEWVKIRAGYYKGDVGVVCDHDHDHASVLIIPRIPTITSKAASLTNRPTPVRLLKADIQERDLGLVEEKYTSEDITVVSIEKLGSFENGLLIKNFSHTTLELAKAIPPEIFQQFMDSNHPLVRHSTTMPLPHFWSFREGERVHVERNTVGRMLKAHSDYCEVETDQGLQSYRTDEIRKIFEPGDHVEVLAGKNAGVTGTVTQTLGDQVNILLLPVDLQLEQIWVHANSITVLTPSTVYPCPWKDVVVRITEWTYHGNDPSQFVLAPIGIESDISTYRNRVGVVKGVARNEAIGSLFVYLHLPEQERHLEVDYFQVRTISENRYLHEIYPLTDEEKQIYNVSIDFQRTSTPKPPWIGIRVKVTRGKFKDHAGIIKDVNFASHMAHRQSGIRLIVELQTLFAAHGIRSVDVDYDDVREYSSMFPLADAVKPRGRQHVYLPRKDRPGKARKMSHHPHPALPRSRTPTPPPPISTPVQKVEWNSFYGEKRPLHFVPTESDHWILHPRLNGIPIRVDITDGKEKTLASPNSKGKFVESTKSIFPSGGYMTVLVSEKGDRKPVPTNDVQLYRQRPSLKGKGKNLMVVIRGEFVGTKVRQLRHFLNAEKNGEGWLIMAVMGYSDDKEAWTEAKLDISPEDVELVSETIFYANQPHLIQDHVSFSVERERMTTCSWLPVRLRKARRDLYTIREEDLDDRTNDLRLMYSMRRI